MVNGKIRNKHGWWELGVPLWLGNHQLMILLQDVPDLTRVPQLRWFKIQLRKTWINKPKSLLTFGGYPQIVIIYDNMILIWYFLMIPPLFLTAVWGLLIQLWYYHHPILMLKFWRSFFGQITLSSGYSNSPCFSWSKHNFLVGGWATPLKNMKVSWDDYSHMQK